MAQYEYEWDIETVVLEDSEDGYAGDIIDHDFLDTLRLPTEANEVLVLVCDAYYVDGQWERSWAYVKDGRMGTHFKNTYGNATLKIPQKFHSQLKRETAK